MDIDRYLTRHQATWDRLGALVARAKRSPGRLSIAETQELLGLYQRTSAHLSHVRTHHRDREVIERLSARIADARQVLYGRRGRLQRTVGRFFTHSFPLAVFRSRRAIGVAAVLLFGTAIATALWMTSSAEARNIEIPPETQQLIAERDFEGYYSESAASDFAAAVQTNNIVVSLICLAGASTAGVLTGVILVSNGFHLGVMTAVMYSHGASGTFWTLILPHGLLELAAVTVIGGVALKVGWALIAPGEGRTRGDAVMIEARHAIAAVLGVSLWLVIAGFIEAWVTPSSLSSPVRIGIGAAASAMAVLHVLAFGPRAEAEEASEADEWDRAAEELHAVDRRTGVTGKVVAPPVDGSFAIAPGIEPRPPSQE